MGEDKGIRVTTADLACWPAAVEAIVGDARLWESKGYSRSGQAQSRSNEVHVIVINSITDAFDAPYFTQQ